MTTFGHLSTLIFLLSMPAFGVVISDPLPDRGVMSRDNNNQIDPQIDYESFSGRVTDKDDNSRIFKVKVENNNSKFFRAGDKVLFKVNQKEGMNHCTGFVRSVEDFYFSIYVDSLAPCYSRDEYFRRGTVLNFSSPVLSQRVFEASQYRNQLIVRKEDFMSQLNGINHFLWTYDQQKVKTASDYDEQINRLQREKRKALDDMITLKQEKLILQNELMRKLTELDESLKFYRVERQELMSDRWNLDHDLGLPFAQRPQEEK